MPGWVPQTRCKERDRLSAPFSWALVVHGTLFAAIMSGCAARTVPAPLPDTAEADKVVWMFEQVERGAIVSSPCLAGDRGYVAAIRDAGLSTSGAVYCLNRRSCA